MKRAFVYLSVLLFIVSCDNELNLIDDYQDIPVVYGILSLPATDQYIRIEKAFVDPVISAVNIAQNPDSLYYENATVTILAESSNVSYTLERIDGADYGFERDPGVFATDPNVLYRISSDEFVPQEEETYVLQIQRGTSESLVTARIKMVAEPKIIRPSQSGNANLDFIYNIPTILKWRGGDVADQTGLFDLNFDLKYKERNIDLGGDFVNKTYRWNILSNFSGEELELEGKRFYEAMAVGVESNPSMVRRFIGIDLILSVGGIEIKDYVRIGQANSGLTSSQDIPTYTNLSEGRGLFSSRYTVTNSGISITPRSLDSLINGQITQQLNFIE